MISTVGVVVNTMPTELYRHYDRNGRLLYVGVSLSTVARLAGHRECSHWFDQITNVTIERFATREIALIAEQIAIWLEKPAFNIAHSNTEFRKSNGTFSFNGLGEMFGVSGAIMRSIFDAGRLPIKGDNSGRGMKFYRVIAEHHFDAIRTVIDEYLAENPQ